MPKPAKRPAPPTGVKVLRTPEIVRYSAELARARGDGRAVFQPQDVWADIQAGRLAIGNDAFWRRVRHHPTGGYWVVTATAVDRRIQERLRGRGRPVKTEAPKVLDVTQADQAEAPVTTTTNRPIMQPPVVAVLLDDGSYSPLIVADQHRYLAAVQVAASRPGPSRGMVYVCTCGWAGVSDELDNRICPACRGQGRHLVETVDRALTGAQQSLLMLLTRPHSEIRTRQLRQLQAHLEILALQARVEEALTPGLEDQVRKLLEHGKPPAG